MNELTTTKEKMYTKVKLKRTISRFACGENNRNEIAVRKKKK